MQLSAYLWQLEVPAPVIYSRRADENPLRERSRRWISKKTEHAFDEKLAARVRKFLNRGYSVEEKRMFGGLTFMVNGHMYCGVLKKDLFCVWHRKTRKERFRI